MAQQSLAQINKQIAALQAQAEKLRTEEKAGAVAKVKQLIADFGLTVADLFHGRRTFGKRAKAKSTGAVAFADDNGNTWVGRGPRPQWLRDALARGRTLEEFAVGAKKAGAPRAARAAGSTKARTTTKPAKKAGAAPAKKRAATKKGSVANKRPAAKKRASLKASKKASAPAKRAGRARASASPVSGSEGAAAEAQAA